MKTYSRALLALLLMKATVAFPQSPRFNVYIANESYPSAKTYRFEIWLKKTSPGILEIANLQFGIHVNANFRNGGSITPEFVPGSSMFVVSQAPLNSGQISYVNAVASGIDRINITARFNPGCGAGTLIPDTEASCTSSGIRFATVQLTTSLSSWSAGVKPNLDFNFTRYSLIETKISYYPQPCPTSGYDATPKGTFYDFNNAGLLCNPNPVTPGCSLIVSTSINFLNQPTCFGATGSFTIANTFSSFLLNGQTRYSIDGIPVGVVASQGTVANFPFSNVARGVHFINIERGIGYATVFPFGGGTTLCSAGIYVTITEPLPITTTASVVSPIDCYGENGEIAVTASGGSGTYKYLSGANFISGPVDLQTLPAGIYSFTVTDQNNCPAAVTDSITLTDPEEVTMDAIENSNATCLSCDDGAITVHASGGSGWLTVYLSEVNHPENTFSVTDTGQVFNFSGLVPNTYEVDVVSNTGCWAQPATITIPSCIDSYLVHAEICEGSFYVLPNGNVADTSGIYSIALPNSSGCDSIIVTHLTVNPCHVTLNLRIFIEGFYVGGERMKAILDPIHHPDLFDSVTVELHHSFSPYGISYRVMGLIDTSGFGRFNFSFPVSGDSYYVVARHRNSLAVWSRDPVLFDSSVVTFDFTKP